MKYQAIIVTLAFTASLFGQQPAKKTAATAQSSPNTVRPAPPDVRQRILKLMAARKPVTITIPIAATRTKLKHQEVMLKLDQQKQVVAGLRMKLMSAQVGGRLPIPPPDGKGGGGGMQGTKSGPSLIQESEIRPSGNVGLVQQRRSPPVSPTANVPDAAVCHGPTIDTVDDRPIGAAIFSTDPQHNGNTIGGCGFGTQPGTVYLTGPFATPRVSMHIDFWTDKGIVVEVDPNLSGELDHFGNVTLVIVAANGQQTQATGFTFYAARARTQLSMFPQSQTALQPITDAAGQFTVNVAFYSPPSSASSYVYGGLMAPGATLEVNRFDAGRFGGVWDKYDFTQLSPGFYLDTIDFGHFDMTADQCAADYYMDGNWKAWWVNQSNQLIVSTQEQHCHVSPTLNTPSYDYSFSIYAVSVWVVGPRGANPWPGNLH